MLLLYNIVSDILCSAIVCVDFLGIHMMNLVLFLKLGVTVAEGEVRSRAEACNELTE
jgi:hypothetical protein